MAKRRCFGSIGVGVAQDPAAQAETLAQQSEKTLDGWAQEEDDGRAEKGIVVAFKCTLGRLSDFIAPFPTDRWGRVDGEATDGVASSETAASSQMSSDILDAFRFAAGQTDSIDLGMSIATLGAAVKAEARTCPCDRRVIRWLVDQVAYGQVEPATQAKRLLAEVLTAGGGRSSPGWFPAGAP